MGLHQTELTNPFLSSDRELSPGYLVEQIYTKSAISVLITIHQASVTALYKRTNKTTIIVNAVMNEGSKHIGNDGFIETPFKTEII